MDRGMDTTSSPQEISTPTIEDTSAVYVARWNHLVSTTNWEKGRIIHEWRAALIAAGAGPAEYSDDAWSRRLQLTTPQHIGRLRRVWERFGERYTSFDGLYWSHFQAALDWSDAEMWLEGAVHNDWSISAMRAERTRTLAATGQDVSSEPVDAALELESADVADSLAGDEADEHREIADEPLRPTASRMDDLDDAPCSADTADGDNEWVLDSEVDTSAEPVRPFAALAELPPDLSDAFEAFKLGILRHKLAGWMEISRAEVLGALDALKELALAPSD